MRSKSVDGVGYTFPCRSSLTRRRLVRKEEFWPPLRQLDRFINGSRHFRDVSGEPFVIGYVSQSLRFLQNVAIPYVDPPGTDELLLNSLRVVECVFALNSGSVASKARAALNIA